MSVKAENEITMSQDVENHFLPYTVFKEENEAYDSENEAAEN
jgi:hypothetical protein